MNNPLSQRKDSDEEGTNLDILELRNNKIPKVLMVFMYILGLISVILISISFGCMLFNPVNEQEYLNNIKLQESIQYWESSEMAEEFKSYKFELVVKSFSKERKLEKIPFQTVDKRFNLTQSPGYFEKQFKNNEYMFGVFDFEYFNVPLGDSAQYCLQIKYYDKVKKVIYHKTSYSSLQKEPQCSLMSSNKYDKIDATGIKISPWRQIKTECKECVCTQGIKQIIDGQQFCFQYEVLTQVCIVVQITPNKQVEYLRGCYKNNTYQVFRAAQVQENLSFEDLTLEIREIQDPYITALSLSQNDIPIKFENANFPSIIRLLFEIGFGILVFTIMLNLAYKANRSPSANRRRTRITSIIYLKDQ
ncbi:hypothetical protein ABPG74_004769 [Tetrahymena malaccensis]